MKPTWDQLRIAEQISRAGREREQALRDRIRREKDRRERRERWSDLQRAYWHATHCRRVCLGGFGPVADEARQYFVDQYRKAVGFHPLECGCEDVE